MKTIQLLICALLVSANGLAQSFNAEIDSETKKAALVGKINKEGLSNGPYAAWFNKNYSDYQPKNSTLPA
ncbi:MAG: hypothetical protein AAF466_14490 [Bacteroidota bacterium]